MSSDKQYSRRLGSFRGVDLSSSPAQVNPARFAYIKNMYRDYDSEQGDATETVPGFRRLMTWAGKKINGIYQYMPAGGYLYILIHAGTYLYKFKHSDRDMISGNASLITTFSGLANARSSALMFGNRLYIIDGTNYWMLNGSTLTKVTTNPYIPITYVNGEQYEQRNMLSHKTVNRDTQMLEYDLTELYTCTFAETSVGVNGFKEGYSTDVIIIGQYINGKAASIFSNAFKDKTAIKKVYLYQAVYGTSVFEGCTALELVSMQYNSTLGANAFKNCTALTTVYLGNATTGIPEAFVGCTAITNVHTLHDEAYWAAKSPTLAAMFPAATIHYESASTIDLVGPTIRSAKVYDPADIILGVTVDSEAATEYGTIYHVIDSVSYVDGIYTTEDWTTSNVDITLSCKPSEFKTSEGYVTFKDGNTDYTGTSIDAITKCRICASFDGRTFFTGNPALPNTVFYSQRDLTGHANPTYFGVLNYINDGTGTAGNTAMMGISNGDNDVLLVFKGDTVQDGAVYRHMRADTGSDIIPVTYGSKQGIAGLGCVGAACNFRDDPVFLSERGVESMGKLQVNQERNIEHRSFNVDRLLIAEDLAAASLVEWRGYLAIICPSGNMYLADSRQITQHATGASQYEWYRLEGVGVYTSQVQDWKLTTGRVEMYDSTGALHWLNDTECWVLHAGERKRLYLAAAEDFVPYATVYSTYIYTSESGADVYYSDEEHTTQFAAYVAEYNDMIYLVESDADFCPFTGGTFSAASAGAAVGDVLYFGTANGDICCFNNDKRSEAYGGVAPPAGTLHPHWYTYDGRTIISALSTAYDDAGYPDLAKKTVSKSMVVHTKVFSDSRFSVLVRTDRTDEWKNVGEISNSTLDFTNLNFANSSLKVSDDALFTVREKEKKWAKKQLHLISDHHMSPFGLYQIGYRFQISGRIKS